MTIKNRVFICCLLLSMTLTAQEQVTSSTTSKVPTSIFIEQLNLPPIGSYEESLSETLKLKNFKFLIFDNESLMRNSLMIDLRNIGRRGTQFFSQTYRDFDLYKHFPVVPDIISLNQFAINIDREIY